VRWLFRELFRHEISKKRLHPNRLERV